MRMSLWEEDYEAIEVLMLLISSSEDSTARIKEMLDKAIAKRKEEEKEKIVFNINDIPSQKKLFSAEQKNYLNSVKPRFKEDNNTYNEDEEVCVSNDNNCPLTEKEYKQEYNGNQLELVASSSNQKELVSLGSNSNNGVQLSIDLDIVNDPSLLELVKKKSDEKKPFLQQCSQNYDAFSDISLVTSPLSEDLSIQSETSTDSEGYKTILTHQPESINKTRYGEKYSLESVDCKPHCDYLSKELMNKLKKIKELEVIRKGSSYVTSKTDKLKNKMKKSEHEPRSSSHSKNSKHIPTSCGNTKKIKNENVFLQHPHREAEKYTNEIVQIEKIREVKSFYLEKNLKSIVAETNLNYDSNKYLENVEVISSDEDFPVSIVEKDCKIESKGFFSIGEPVKTKDIIDKSHNTILPVKSNIPFNKVDGKGSSWQEKNHYKKDDQKKKKKKRMNNNLKQELEVARTDEFRSNKSVSHNDKCKKMETETSIKEHLIKKDPLRDQCNVMKLMGKPTTETKLDEYKSNLKAKEVFKYNKPTPSCSKVHQNVSKSNEETDKIKHKINKVKNDWAKPSTKHQHKLKKDSHSIKHKSSSHKHKLSTKGESLANVLSNPKFNRGTIVQKKESSFNSSQIDVRVLNKRKERIAFSFDNRK